MPELLVVTDTQATGAPHEVLPALSLLRHRVRTVAMEPSALIAAPTANAILLDARLNLHAARSTARLLRATGLGAPLILVVTEGGLTAVRHDWGADDIIVSNASPAEVEARIRLAIERAAGASGGLEQTEIGDLIIDTGGYTARLRGHLLDLTYKEFELLRYLAGRPGRVFTRTQLVQELWGYDYYGGTRTVDVHVRRLRAKLGPEHDHLIGTVRGVGYRFEEHRPAPGPRVLDKAR